MLDDLKFIANRDHQDALGVAEKLPEQLLYQFDFQHQFKPIQNVVLGGLGGSAHAAQLMYDWPTPSIPFVIVRNYQLPDFVDEKTLFIASSYSGNTDETLVMFEQAREKGAQIVAIASGGKLEATAKEHSLPFIKIPVGFQPRLATWYSFRALLEIFESAGLASGLLDELESSVESMQSAITEWRPDVKTVDNFAKELAEHIAGKTPVIYSGVGMQSIAMKWKIAINENSKNLAFYNVLPEMNHNEMIGWDSHPVEKPFAPIFLTSSFDDERIHKRFEVMLRVLSGKMPHPKIVKAQGDNILEHLLWLWMLGDFVSIYLALINNVDPTPVALVEKFKKML